MDKFLYVLVIIVLIIACERDNDNININKTNKYKAEIVSGNNQSGYLFELLNENLIIKIEDENHRRYKFGKIIFQTDTRNENYYTISGSNGDILYDYGPSEFDSLYCYKWLLGCQNNIQELTAIVQDSAENIIDTLVFNAVGKKRGNWNRTNGIGYQKTYEFSFQTYQKIVKQSNGDIYYLTNNFLYKSIDNGKSIFLVESFPYKNNFWLNDLCIVAEDAILVGTRENGIYKSIDGGNTWGQINNGLENISYASKLIYLGNQEIYCETGYGLHHRSKNNGQNWFMESYQTSRTNFIGTIVNIVRHPNNNLYLLEYYESNIYVSDDDGMSWRIINTNLFFNDVTALDIDIDGNLLIINMVNGETPTLYKSNDLGANWNKISEFERREGSYSPISKIVTENNSYYVSAINGIIELNNAGQLVNLTQDINNPNGTFLVNGQGKIIFSNDKGIYYNYE